MVASLSCIAVAHALTGRAAGRGRLGGFYRPVTPPARPSVRLRGERCRHTPCADNRAGIARRAAATKVRFMDKPTISLIRSKCFVDGQWNGEGRLAVTNKATGEIITRGPEFGESGNRAAIEA